MASSGAKVLHPRAAEICMSYKIPIHIRSSFHMREGTWIREGARPMEEAEVVGVTSDKKIAKITLLNVPDEPGVAAQIFKDVADKDINIRLIIQSAAADHRAGITFIIEDEFADMARKLVSDWTQKGLAREGMVEKDWATIAIIGHRLAATPGLVGAHVRLAGQCRHQRRLHQFIGNDAVVHHQARSDRSRRESRA